METPSGRISAILDEMCDTMNPLLDVAEQTGDDLLIQEAVRCTLLCDRAIKRFRIISEIRPETLR